MYIKKFSVLKLIMWGSSASYFTKHSIRFFDIGKNNTFISTIRCVSNNTRVKDPNDAARYFGFQEVSPSEKREKVQSVFTNVAEKYDLMNDVMSVGIHRLWKDYFMHKLSPTVGTKLLDVAGGTGDIAFRFLRATRSDKTTFQTNVDQNTSHVTVLDMNAKMLSICKKRGEETNLNHCLNCVQGNAECLPFTANTFDAYTIAFGIRNVVHIDKALAEAFRILKPGGRFLCLEFSEVRNLSLNKVYHWYSHEIIPVLGELIAGDWKSYQYLVESIQKFPNQEDFKEMIKEAGFKVITYENLCNGIAAIHSAYKL